MKSSYVCVTTVKCQKLTVIQLNTLDLKLLKWKPVLYVRCIIRDLQLQCTACCIWPQIRKWKSIDLISVLNLAINRSPRSRTIRRTSSRCRYTKNRFRRLWLICHDLEREKKGGATISTVCSRWYPCDVPLTTGSLKVQSARHSLAATAWQRSRCSRARPKRRTGVKKKKRKKKRNDAYIIYTGDAFDASVFHLSIIIIAKTSRGNRPPIAITARICQKWRKNIAGQTNY